MIVVYKASSLITILDTLSRLKASLETKAIDNLLTKDKNKTTNIFILTLAKLKDNLSQSILEGISRDTKIKGIH